MCYHPGFDVDDFITLLQNCFTKSPRFLAQLKLCIDLTQLSRKRIVIAPLAHADSDLQDNLIQWHYKVSQFAYFTPQLSERIPYIASISFFLYFQSHTEQ